MLHSLNSPSKRSCNYKDHVTNDEHTLWWTDDETRLVIFLFTVVNVVSQSSQIHRRFASEMEIPPLSRLASGEGPFCIAPFASAEERSNGSHCARSRQGAAASAVPPLRPPSSQWCPRTQAHNLPPLLTGLACWRPGIYGSVLKEETSRNYIQTTQKNNF